MQMKFAVLISLGILCSGAGAVARADTSLETTSDALRDIQNVKSERDVNLRGMLANDMLTHLYKVWDAHAIDTIDDRVIDKLVLLLDDDDDAVRGPAAAAIGYFGVRARRAVPALHDALVRLVMERKKRGDILALGLDSASSIEVALQRVQGVPDRRAFEQPQPLKSQAAALTEQ